MKSRTKRKITPWLFLAPFLAAFLIFMAYPTVYSIVLSFMKFQAGKYTFLGCGTSGSCLRTPCLERPS